MSSIYGNFKNRERVKIQQNFDKEKIFVTKQGQKINCFDSIQAANVDTNIYDVMKKYHCQENEAMELMKSRGGEQGIFANIVELQEKIKDIGDVQDVAQRAQELFEQLPAEIKNKYGNDLNAFFKDQKAKAEEEERKAEELKTTETKTKTEVKTNEIKQ